MSTFEVRLEIDCEHPEYAAELIVEAVQDYGGPVDQQIRYLAGLIEHLAGDIAEATP